jgi:hypothetical protein
MKKSKSFILKTQKNVILHNFHKTIGFHIWMKFCTKIKLLMTFLFVTLNDYLFKSLPLFDLHYIIQIMYFAIKSSFDFNGWCICYT